MECNGLFSNLGSSGMVGLHQNHHPQMMLPPFNHNPQNHLSLNPNYPYNHNSNPNPKHQKPVSDEDDQHITGGTKTKDNGVSSSSTQWHRMKWTGNMVNLLISAVYYIGDDHLASANEADVAAGKKKPGGGSGANALLQQKKGKWKSVSKAMMEKGFFVSPQQCEDKFNDLNKRYKRVNDVLGKGIACKVVENQNLLDSIHHLSAKMKDEARKLLNSKHLFFREMCAYHNSCASGGGGGGINNQEEDTMIVEPSHRYDQMCHHSSDTTNNVKTLNDPDKHDDEDYDGEDNDDDDDEDEDEDDNQLHQDEGSTRKRARKCLHYSPRIQQLSGETMNIMNDGSKNAWEKKQWVKMQLMKLEEERVSYQCEGFEIEKRRLKWAKFSSNKEREMERAKLNNERTKLETERMLLVLRQKELELIQFHQHYQQQQQQQHSSNKRASE